MDPNEAAKPPDRSGSRVRVGRFARLGRLARPGLELADEIVEVEALELAGDGVELALAVLDQRLALAAELERLAELGLALVEAEDDLLESLDRGLVARRRLRRALCLTHHRPPP